MRDLDNVILNTSGDRAKILEDNQDLMEVIISCPNCGQPTRYGDTLMISGYVGCTNEFLGGVCYWDDLMPRVLTAKESSNDRLRQAYIDGKLYAVGYKLESEE